MELPTIMCIKISKWITVLENVEKQSVSMIQKWSYQRKIEYLSTSYQQNVDKLITANNNKWILYYKIGLEFYSKRKTWRNNFFIL